MAGPDQPGDTPWSDREFASDAARAASDDFQGRGIAPEAIAESAYDAILHDRFYVFTGDRTHAFLDATIGRTLRAEDPAVTTWGEDRRPADRRFSIFNAS